jgi:hypothetical protein
MSSGRYSPAEEAEFRRLWAEGATLLQIAEKLSRTCGNDRSTMVTMSTKARRLGLGRRPGGPARKANGDFDDEAEQPVARVAQPPMPAHPFWTPSLDAKILQSQGRYREISDLSVQLRKPHASILQRWHLLRAS